MCTVASLKALAKEKIFDPDPIVVVVVAIVIIV